MQEIFILGILGGVIALLITSMFTNRWTVLAVAFLLSIVGGFVSFDVEKSFCAEIVGNLECTNLSVVNIDLMWAFIVLGLMSAVVFALRITTKSLDGKMDTDA